MEIAVLPNPGVLFTRVSWHILEPRFGQHIVNKSGTIHTASRRIGGSILVGQILLGQRQSLAKQLLDLRWLIFELADIFRILRGDMRRSWRRARFFCGCTVWRFLVLALL